jgi:hypothetical protein
MKTAIGGRLISWICVALLLPPLIGIARDDGDRNDKGDKDGKRAVIVVDPAHAGDGAYAGWGRDAGQPGRDSGQFGLDLRHLRVTTPDGPYAGTRNLLRRPISATTLDRLSFDISGRSGENGMFVPGDARHGYCTGGAPRFVVESDSGTCHLGCGHGNKAQDPDTNWWTVSFEPPFSRYPGCPVEPAGTIQHMDITHDEGPSEVVLDNISATIGGRTTTVTGPQDDKGNDHDD